MTKSKFQRNFILISLRFQCFDFPEFWLCCQNRNFNFVCDFDCLLSTKSKFKQNFILIFTKFRRQESEFQFRFWCFKIRILNSVSISITEFRFWFQSIFHWNKSKFLFWLLIGVSILTTEIEILKILASCDSSDFGPFFRLLICSNKRWLLMGNSGFVTKSRICNKQPPVSLSSTCVGRVL
jgi:hypothetical protein